MYLLRRTAVRALSQQTNSLSRTYHIATPRVTSLSQTSSKPIAWRSFHQARIWRADEEQKGELAQAAESSPTESESAGETVTAEPSVEEQQAEIKEESIATPEVADAAPAASEETVTQKVQQTATNAANTARDTLDTTTRAARPPRPNRPREDSFGGHRNPKPSKILYVGNLFFEVDAQKLEREFSQYGQITNSRVVTDARGLSKGFGYIEMATQEAADNAIRELDQKVFEGRRMAVQYHVRRETRNNDRAGERPPHEPSKTLFIGNMSYQMSDRDLNDLFREIRDVLDVRVAIDRRSGQPRGFAHADFIDIQSAERAKQHLEKKVVYGRQLRVDFSGSSNNSSRDGDRQ